MEPLHSIEPDKMTGFSFILADYIEWEASRKRSLNIIYCFRISAVWHITDVLGSQAQYLLKSLVCVCMKRKKKILISHSPWRMFTDIWPRSLGSYVQVRCQIRVRLVNRHGSHRVCRYVHVKKTNMQGSKNIWLKKWAECSVCQEIIKSWKSKHLYDVTQLQYNTSALRSASLRTSRFRCLGLFVSTGCVLSLHPVVAIRRMAYFVSLHSHIWKSRNHGDTSQNTANQLNDTMGKNNHRGALSTAVFPTRRLQFHWMPRYINGRPIVFCNQF